VTTRTRDATCSELFDQCCGIVALQNDKRPYAIGGRLGMQAQFPYARQKNPFAALVHARQDTPFALSSPLDHASVLRMLSLCVSKSEHVSALVGKARDLFNDIAA
jgi:hypothetical protein